MRPSFTALGLVSINLLMFCLARKFTSVQVTVPEELAHVDAGAEGQVADPQPPLARHGYVEQECLSVNLSS